MISVLYFIKKINAQYNNKTNNINDNGSIIDGSIVLVPLNLILAGWWRVFHHSTEYFIIGKFIDPKTAISDEIFIAVEFSLINLMLKM